MTSPDSAQVPPHQRPEAPVTPVRHALPHAVAMRWVGAVGIALLVGTVGLFAKSRHDAHVTEQKHLRDRLAVLQAELGGDVDVLKARLQSRRGAAAGGRQ